MEKINHDQGESAPGNHYYVVIVPYDGTGQALCIDVVVSYIHCGREEGSGCLVAW